MMRSVLVTSPYHYEIVESEIPTSLAENEVLIQLKAVGVCGSDIHIFHGKNAMAHYPVVLGHENAGVVVQCGSNVTNCKPGDRVVIEQTCYCGECYPCSIGHSNVCENLRVRGCTIDGGFREYMTCQKESIYHLPDEVSFVEGAMVEPFTIAAQSVETAQVRADDTVLILGVGTIGSTVLQTCLQIGARVLVADVDEGNLERARYYGAASCLNIKDGQLAEQVWACNGGQGVTVAIDAACFTGSLTMLFSPGVVRNAGRVLCLGFSGEPERLSQAMLTGRNLTLYSSRLQSGKYPQVIREFAQKHFHLERLVTDVIPFQEISRVFEQMLHPSPDVKKMVITFE